MTLKRTWKKGVGRVYVDESGREFPSVTTVLGSTLKPGPWLGTWQDRMRRGCFVEGYEAAKLKDENNIPVYDLYDESLKHPNAYRDAAGKRGTLYHNALEAYFNGTQVDSFIAEDPRIKDVLNSISEWEEKTKLDPIKVEYYIASPRWGYGGTIDLMAYQTIEGRKTLCLFDFKTGSLQRDALLQLAAYASAFEETEGKRPDKAAFVKVDIDKGTVKEDKPLSYHDIAVHTEMFLKTFDVWKWRTLKQF